MELSHPEFVKNVKDKNYNIYIGRSLRGYKDLGFSNPFKLYSNSDRARYLAIVKYCKFFLENTALHKATLLELKDKTLGCWCTPKLCHGNILSFYANSPLSHLEKIQELIRFIDYLEKVIEAQVFRVLVTGSRTWEDKEVIFKELDQLQAQFPQITLIHGGAIGADTIAQEWAVANSVSSEIWLPDWDKFGKSAGMLRNVNMINSGVDTALAFLDNNSPGTSQAIKTLKNARAHFKVITSKLINE